MSTIRMNEQQRTVWWVTCGHPHCDYESPPITDHDEAENLRLAHYALHDQQKRATVSDAVAKHVTEARKARRWGTGDLAARCAELGHPELTENVIENIESGRRDQNGRRRRDVTVDELRVFADALGFSPADMLGGLPSRSDLSPRSESPPAAQRAQSQPLCFLSPANAAMPG